MKQEPGKWKAFNVKAICNNVELVFRSRDIGRLNNPAYDFIYQHMGFIAHYDINGFKAEYNDLRIFAVNLQNGEGGGSEDYNLHQADRQETDRQFNEWYGEAYNKSMAETMRGIVAIARKYQPEITADLDAEEKENELTKAKAVFEKYGVTV